jgi:hypothetical protein
MASEVVGPLKEGTMSNADDDALREQWLVLMAAAPMCDYLADPGVYARVGKLLAEQAEEQAYIRRWGPR